MFLLGLIIGAIAGVIGKAWHQDQLARSAATPIHRYRHKVSGRESRLVCMASDHDSMASYAILNTIYDERGSFSVRSEVWPADALVSEFEKIEPQISN